MSVTTTKDGRHRVRYPKGTLLYDPNRDTEWFGRGEAELQRALARDAEIQEIRRNKKVNRTQSPSFEDLVNAYLKAKNGVVASTTMDALVPKFYGIF